MFLQTHWQPVFETHNEAEARVVAGMLETRGIMARLRQERVRPSMTILVDSRDYEQARRFVHQDILQ
jgi:hypothetical protein